jgi:hypothetical protein
LIESRRGRPLIVVAVPDERHVIAAQEREGALYFSIAADSVVRRTGIVNVAAGSLSEIDLTDPRQRVVVTRAAQPAPAQLASILERASAWEGPLADPVLSALGLRGEVERITFLDLYDRDGSFRWQPRRSETSFVSEAGVDQLAEWQSPDFPIQIITGAIDDVWLVGRLPDGREFPAVFRSGKAWISAFPLFDIGGEFLTFAPLPGRWNRRHTMVRYEEMAGAIIGHMAAHLAADGSIPVVKVDDWPQGYANALCVRHDYDRATSDAAMQALLDFYAQRGLVSSIGFLSYQLPDELIRALVARGHEIQIHVWQSDRNKFLEDVVSLSRLAGVAVAGATAHGNERGFRGDAHYDWFEEAGLEYAELFRIGHAPAPIYRLAPSGVLRRSSLMGTPGHFSLDINNNPEVHQLDVVRSYSEAALEAGAGVIPMNHPDINRAALYELLDGLPIRRPGDPPRRATWRASLRDMARWTRVTHFDSTVEYGGGPGREELTLRFGAALPQPLRVSVAAGGGEAQIYGAAVGQDRITVPLTASH